ncbi:hypothetical protein SAMN04488539_0307 [Corynebacterium timonense]|uniref:Uncharacterized protein n=1 Tax=Corynebacterium timonense TaxID=441500 RepID=A0A1H1LR35_9CORY|nr:hypothetical protein SAMN04488539_0307 [Corynebacterium timonense]
MTTFVHACGGEAGVETRCPDCGTYGWRPGTSRYQLTPRKARTTRLPRDTARYESD